MGLKVDSGYVRDTILAPLIGRGARYEGIVDMTTLDDLVLQAKQAVEQELSTRFAPTKFVGFIGQGPRPQPTAAGTDPVTPAVEIEPPYLWPNVSPSAGFLSFRLRIRPVLELIEADLRLPGSPDPGVTLKPNWFRVNNISGELVLMPDFAGASLVMPNLPFGLFAWMHQRIPEAVMFTYIAGMDTQDWQRFPQINRLVALRAAIAVLPVLSMRINPTGVTSKSADGLSVSRSSGYAFKDLEERLDKEATAIKTQVLDAWEGTSALSIM